MSDAGVATDETGANATVVVRTASFDHLDAATLYELLRLRAEVFVVEQRCAFADLDGRDRDPSTEHLWLERDGEVVAYARVLRDETQHDETEAEIGRIVTRFHLRGTGLGARIMTEAMARIDGPIHLKAQARLADWYERFGFQVVGQAFMDDGIAHVPMRYEP